MNLDTDRIDDAVLALLQLGLHEDVRAWKSFDWDAMDRLHQKGYISNPVGKAKSVVFTEFARPVAPGHKRCHACLKSIRTRISGNQRLLPDRSD